MSNKSKAIFTRKFSTVNKSMPSSIATGNKQGATGAKAPATRPLLAGSVVGAAGPLGPGLRPIARLEVMSETRHITFNGTVGVLSSTNVCDPTGIATDALAVNGWSNRFGGFQQYRIRSTKWVLVPLRTNVGTTTSSQAPGHVGMWIQDTPQAGNPATPNFLEANRRMILCNQERIEYMTYATNEPQDLNLSDIQTPPSHITNASIQQGQHCCQVYGDDTVTGILGLPNSGFIPLFSLTAVYDIEFFGVGGV
jgi:hypothetical protein